MYELIYTSAVKGLLPGRSGFTTVAVTRGMPPNLITPLENLSGYNFTLQDNKFLAGLNPVCCYYIKLQYGNQLLRVVGRIAPNGLDYSKRNNKIAHHLLLESGDDLAPYTGGAAEIFDTPDMFASDFKQHPCELGVKHLPQPFNKNLLPAETWADFSGDGAMAAWVVNEFRKHPHDALYLAYPANTPSGCLLQLVKEVCALLEPAERPHVVRRQGAHGGSGRGRPAGLHSALCLVPVHGSLQKSWISCSFLQRCLAAPPCPQEGL